MLFFSENDTITEILNLKNYFYFPLCGVSYNFQIRPSFELHSISLNPGNFFIPRFSYKKHNGGRPKNNHIPNYTVNIRQIPHKNKTEHGGENNLRIIKHRNFLGRSVAVGGCHAELSSSRRKPRQKKHRHLIKGHRLIFKQNIR